MDNSQSSNLSNLHNSESDWNWLNVFYASAREVGEIVIDDFATIKRRSIDKNEEALKIDSGFNSWLARNVVKNFVQSINKSLENLGELKVDVIKELKRRYPNLEGDWLSENYGAVSSSVKSPTLHSGGPLIEIEPQSDDVRCDEEGSQNNTTDELVSENGNPAGRSDGDVELVEPVDPLELDLNEVVLSVTGDEIDKSEEAVEVVEKTIGPDIEAIENEDESFEESNAEVIGASDEDVENEIPIQSQSLLSADYENEFNDSTVEQNTSGTVEAANTSLHTVDSQDDEEVPDVELTSNSLPNKKKGDEEEHDSDTTVYNNRNNLDKSSSALTLDSGDEDLFASPAASPVSVELNNIETVNDNVIISSTPISNNKPQSSSPKQKTSYKDLKDKKRVLMSDSSDEDFKPTPNKRKSKSSKDSDKKAMEKTPQKNLSTATRKKSKVSSSEDEDDAIPARSTFRSGPKKTNERRKKVDLTYWKTHDFKDDPKLKQKVQVVLETLDPEIAVDLEKKGFIKVQDSSSMGESDSTDEDDRRITRAIKNIDKFDPFRKDKDSRHKAGPKGRKLRDRASKKEIVYDATSEDNSSDDESFKAKVVKPKVPKAICSNDESSSSSENSGTDDETAKANVLSDSDDEKVKSDQKEKKKEKSGDQIRKESKGPKPKYYTPAVCKLSSSSDDEAANEKAKSDKAKIKPKSKRKDIEDDNSSDDFTATKRRVLRKRKVSSESENSDKASKGDSSESDSSLDAKRSKKKAKPKKDSSEDEKPNKKKRRRIKIQHSDDSDDSNGKNASGDDSDIQEIEQGEKTTDSPNKGRKNIRKVLSKKELEKSTRLAEKEEDERKRRVLEKQKLFNEQCKPALPESETLDSVVLDFDEVTKKPTVTVDPTIVCKLKPHQAEGVKFMYNSTIESTDQIEKENPGGGCIIAHCMGLGKTLSSVTFVHSILTNQKMKMKTALIICPLNTVGNWYNEFRLWLKEVDERINVHKLWDQKTIAGRADALGYFMRRGGVGIIHYELFRTLSDLKGQKKLKQSVKDQIYKNLLDPGPDIVICDEGHLLKNDKSKLSISVNKIRTRRRIVLTGTPLQNNLAEYHTMMSFVKPKLLGTLKEFQNRFINPIKNGQHADSDDYDVKLMKRRAHVLHKLLDGCVQRLDYSVLIPYLPPKYEYVVMIKMTPKQVELYKFFLENLKSRTSQLDRHKQLLKNYSLLLKIWTHPVVLTYKTRKQKDNDETDESDDSINDFIVNSDESTSRSSDSDSDVDWVDDHNEKIKKKKALIKAKEEPKEVVEEPVEDDANKELPPDWYLKFFESKGDMKDVELSGKLIVLMEILKICESIGDKLLVFSQYLSSLNLIEEFLANWDREAKEKATKSRVDFPSDVVGRWRKDIEYYRIDGGTKTDVRQDQCDRFNSEHTTRAKLFLISTRAGGLGINLVGANRVVIFDASWNPSHDMQSVFRVFRFGQTKPCYIYRLLAEGTMEEKIYNRQVVKLSLSGRVVDEHQIERHFKFEETNALYNYEDPDEKVDRPIPPVPKDRLLADLLLSQKERITTYLEHDTLLENKMDEGLTDEERKAAWDEYHNEKEARGSQQQNTGGDANTYVKIWKILQTRYNFGPLELKEWSDKILAQINSMQQQLNYYNMYRNVMSAEEEKTRKANIEQLRRWITGALGTANTNTPAAAAAGSSGMVASAAAGSSTMVSSAISQLQQQLQRQQNVTAPMQYRSGTAVRTPSASVVQSNNASPYPLINIASNILDTSETSPEPAVPAGVASGFSDALNIVRGNRPWTNVVPYGSNSKPTNHEN